VEDREQRFEAMLDALRVGVGTPFRFLDLGTGTGSLTERILRRFPSARGVAVDFDPVLLRVARTALGDMGGRVVWVEADLRKRTWAQSLPVPRFDAVVSSTALHWLTGRELRNLYSATARRIRRGGLLLDADALSNPASSPNLRRMARSAGARGVRTAFETWDEWWSAIERDPRFAAEVALRRRRYPHSHMGTRTPDLEGHVRRLRAAGFREVGVIWSHWENRVLAAVR
jgi:SAM-dependent methyltransferase